MEGDRRTRLRRIGKSKYYPFLSKSGFIVIVYVSYLFYMKRTMQNENETTQADDEALARIHSALSVPSNSKLAVFRHEYEHRLRTFTVQNYFGKPHALSPLICARLG